MNIIVWQPGERDYSCVDVNVDDEISVKTWSGAIYIGTVSAVSDKELTIDAVIEKTSVAVYTPGDISYSPTRMTFNLDKVYGIDVILNIFEYRTFEGVKHLTEERFEAFLDLLNEELDPVKAQYDEKVYNGMVDKYQEFAGYKKMVNNIMTLNHGLSFIGLIDKCLNKATNNVNKAV